MKALVIIDMTNDFVYETYEYAGTLYEGKLVAPMAKEIVDKIARLIIKVVKGGTVSVIRIPKDHLNAFMNPELELKAAELGIDEVFITGLVEEVCIYINSLGFLERGFRTNIVKGCTAPFDEEKGREAFSELMECGAKMVDDIPDDIKVILLLEDEHNENSEEIKSGDWPPHNMKGTPGAMTVKTIRDVLEERL
ncbi:cysteine hydrolase family protein [Methanosarcina sp.]|uniref:cysteine hydrolase family protein n=2 Tax=Methanosarcina sp. TaxID=2213 RepID=UPI002988F247|nr:isochorismatase family protein [Methanosarcina sp.]MDW5550672.1 isochorismatase family protein [Methanosarcina sp.]MDW5552435.1 isochorismatase family protein [Methanosarcina sp.]MDW5560166.1 isochorismatase family protein [Methanosarcina sp.]